ncbi:MAG: GTPase RsgA, partial [Chloroflexia bacterium]|nr:GTPase RsgA [Chloroflexia bacterium]
MGIYILVQQRINKKEMIALENFGWNQQLQTYFNENNQTHLYAGRIISIKGFKYILISPEGELEAELSGKMLYTSEQEELPKVGDWVLYSGYESLGYIVGIFPRKNTVCRKIAGKKSEKQILAANIDYALIVQGLDRDFNLMRLERYLVQMANCQVEPIVILNKADLVPDHEYYRTEINRLNRNCPVFFCSTYTGFGLEQLK